MTEQWFLDLDGVRSGPYQTPEVMSLIAEGEVLPHHRISTDLKGEEWITILDWRLDQAKIYQRSSFTSSSEISSMSDQKASSAAPASIQNSRPTPPPILEVPKKMEPVAEVEIEPEIIVEQTTRAEPVVPPAPRAVEPPPAPTPPAFPNETPAPEEPRKPKRDPTAEMFEMLQNSKQKREAKTLKSAIQEQAQFNSSFPNPSKKSSGALGKTLLVGGGIVVLGFLLGQIFQQASPPKEPKEAAKAAGTPFPSPTPESAKTEVVDRSTNKITIRSTVEKPETPIQVTKPVIRPTTPPPITVNPTEKRMNDREIEELRDLKKELQELKNMKDDGHGDPEADPNNPESEVQPGANPQNEDPNVRNLANPNGIQSQEN